jgi:predicted DNA-binding transcriptional regulator AlpA
MVGVSLRTLYRWLYDGLLPEPEMLGGGKVKVRIWTQADIGRARKLLKRRRAKYGGTLRRVLGEFSAQKRGREPGTLTANRVLDLRAETTQQFEAKQHGPELTMQFQPGEEVLTPEDLAKRLKVPVSWVYEQTRNRATVRAKSGPLPYKRMGKYLRFSWSEVVEWLEKQTATTK